MKTHLRITALALSLVMLLGAGCMRQSDGRQQFPQRCHRRRRRHLCAVTVCGAHAVPHSLPLTQPYSYAHSDPDARAHARTYTGSY